MSKDRNVKIAIIGAGPAGLGAAEALKEKGYNNITIFEKSNRVGGQSYSPKYKTAEGVELVYDMGSIQPMSSRILRKLIKKNGLKYGRGPFKKKSKLTIAYQDLAQTEVINFTKYFFGFPIQKLPLVFLDFLKLFYYLFRYRRLAKPGFYNFKRLDETTVDFRQWVKDRKFKFLTEILILQLLSTLTLVNKNNEHKIQLYVVLKFLYQVFKLPIRYFDGTYRPVREGYQELWTRIAKKFTVRLSTKIKEIKRTKDGVVITDDSETQLYDKIFITCPFDKISSIIDASENEKNNFKSINYNPGYRGAFLAKKGPKKGIYWFMDSYDNKDGKSYLSLLFPEGKVDEDTYLYSACFANCADKSNAVDIIKKSTTNFLQTQFDSEITEWVKMHYWEDYDAVFDIEMVKNGVFDKIQNMQGNQNTYYAGQLISSPSHSGVVDYSYELVDLHF